MSRNFSERMGYNPAKLNLQLNGIDNRLRNRLWNTCGNMFMKELLSYEDEIILFKQIWDNFFGLNISDLENYRHPLMDSYDIEQIRENINHRIAGKWYVMYDFVEFLFEFAQEDQKKIFKLIINKVLEQENSGYRIINGLITQITSQQEINEVGEAAQSPYNSVNEHLKTAIQLFSDRENPDFRNSIKEAISAVESLCCIVAEDENATLGKALAKIEQKMTLDGGLKKAINSLYGYTSNEGGIRHKLFEDSQEIKFEDAKFMLVSCSAFINYLIAKNIS